MIGEILTALNHTVQMVQAFLIICMWPCPFITSWRPFIHVQQTCYSSRAPDQPTPTNTSRRLLPSQGRIANNDDFETDWDKKDDLVSLLCSQPDTSQPTWRTFHDSIRLHSGHLFRSSFRLTSPFSAALYLPTNNTIRPRHWGYGFKWFRASWSNVSNQYGQVIRISIGKPPATTSLLNVQCSRDIVSEQQTSAVAFTLHDNVSSSVETVDIISSRAGCYPPHPKSLWEEPVLVPYYTSCSVCYSILTLLKILKSPKVSHTHSVLINNQIERAQLALNSTLRVGGQPAAGAVPEMHGQLPR